MRAKPAEQAESGALALASALQQGLPSGSQVLVRWRDAAATEGCSLSADVPSRLHELAEQQMLSGNVHLEFARLAEGGLKSSTTNGDITVSLPRDVRASLSARVTNGSISASDLNLTTTEQSRRKLEASIGGGGPPVRLSTTNGEIRVRGISR